MSVHSHKAIFRVSNYDVFPRLAKDRLKAPVRMELVDGCGVPAIHSLTLILSVGFGHYILENVNKWFVNVVNIQQIRMNV